MKHPGRGLTPAAEKSARGAMANAGIPSVDPRSFIIIRDFIKQKALHQARTLREDSCEEYPSKKAAFMDGIEHIIALFE